MSSRCAGRISRYAALQVFRVLTGPGSLVISANGALLYLHHRLLAGVFAGERDDGVHVAEAGVVSSGNDTGDRRCRPLTLINDDAQAFLGKIAFVLSPKDEGMNSLFLPVQRNLIGGVLWASAGASTAIGAAIPRAAASTSRDRLVLQVMVRSYEGKLV